MKDNNVFPQRILDSDPEDRFNFFAFSVRERKDTYAHKVFDKLQHTSPSDSYQAVMIGDCRRASAKNITTVIPYSGYARADRKAARKLEFLIGRNNTGPNTYSLGDALGLAQQDDAVTGTAKQNVTDDYAKQLAMGASEAETVVNSALSYLVTSNSSSQFRESASTFSQGLIIVTHIIKVGGKLIAKIYGGKTQACFTARLVNLNEHLVKVTLIGWHLL